MPALKYKDENGEWQILPSTRGMPGPPGPPGPGSGGYVHVQGTPATVWTVTHDLGFHPNVTVVDSADSVVEGEVTYTGDNSLTITFSAGFSGKAYLS